MTSGRMSPMFVLAIIIVFAFSVLAFGADEKPLVINKAVSPNLTTPEHVETTVPLVGDPGSTPEDPQEQAETARIEQQAAEQQAAEESAKQELIDQLNSNEQQNGSVLGEPITSHPEDNQAHAVEPTPEEVAIHNAAGRDIMVSRDGLKVLNLGHSSVYRDPSTVFLSEDFEGTEFPPAGWDTLNTNPGWGWFLGTANLGGTQAALVTWDHDFADYQNEWLMTPDVDVSGATSDLKLEFWFFQGYTWPHEFKVYISTDAGSNWTEIFDSYGTGYPDMEWGMATVDLNSYAGTGNIMIAFQYEGTDANLFGIDDVSINDDAASVGRCCYGDPASPDCADNYLADCQTLGGDWDGTMNCTDDPCPFVTPPDNDACADAEAIGEVTDYAWSTTEATFDGPGDHSITSNNIWYCYTPTVTGEATVSLCGSSFDTKLVAYEGCTCDPIGAEAAYNDDGCSGYPSGSSYASEASFMVTAGQQYLIQVAGYGTGSGDGLLTISVVDMSDGACCFDDGSCDGPMTEEACTTAGGSSWIAGATCDPNLCPQPPQAGDNCADPLTMTLPADLPFADNNTTCGRVDDYENTCLGYYDTGEDIIYQLTVTEAVVVDIMLDPLGTTWSGIMISADCPDDDATCIDYSTVSGSTPHGITALALEPGTYYIMIDTWSTPDCIPEFNLTITSGPPPVGRCCYGDPVACDDITEADCLALSGSWNGSLNCTDNPCETGGNNDFCEEATEVNGPFPVNIDGTTIGATIDCPGDADIGDWAGVWYKIELPYASNNVSVDYCNTPEEIYSVSATLFTECSCDAGVRVYYSWGEFYNCGDAYDVPRLGWDEIPGPGYIYYCVALDAAKSEMNFHFAVNVEEYVVPTGRCCYGDPAAPDCSDGLTSAECTDLTGNWAEGLNCTDNPCPVIMGDNCSDAVEVGPADVVDLEFTTVGATNDGAGYTTGPNIWFCYEAPYTGICTASLCGSGYDTKIAAYDGCVCDPLGTLLGSNDDFCGLQSEIEFAVVAGQTYLIEVGGYGTASGTGVLNISTMDVSISACCDPVTGDCTMLSEPDCIAAGGNWHIGEDCATYTCPPPSSPGDNCEDPITDIKFPADLPWEALSQYTCGRFNNYLNTQMCYTSYGNGEDIVYEIEIDETVTIQITIDPKGTTWTYCQIGTSCPPVAGECDYYFRNSGGTEYVSDAITLAPGTYYMILDTWPTPDCIPDFDISIETAVPPQGRCCYGDPYAPTCAENTEAECMALSGDWDEGMNCTDNPCIPLSSGNDCTDPFSVKIPDDLPLENVNYTCGRGNNFAETCLGYYDGGEDIIYELDVDGDIILDITLDPHVTTYTGIAIFDGCPDVGTCIDYSTAGTAIVHGLEDVSLTTGLYYIMIDTWPSPACIPDFTLTIVEAGQAMGRCCYGDGLAPSCADEVEADCIARPDWLSFDAGLDCTNNPCQGYPENDNCVDANVVTLTSGVPSVVTGDNTNATSDCDDLAPATEAWEAFTIDTTMNVTIEYCGTTPSFDLVYVILYETCPCTVDGGIFATSTDWNACGDGNITMFFEALAPGTYYLPVLAYHPDYPTDYYQGPYTVTFTGTAVAPGYCSASGGCDEYISRVAVGEIDNSSACDGYADYTGMIASMPYGAAIPITVENGNPYSSDQCAVFIDWNGDLDFADADETIPLDVSVGNGPYTGTINVPATAASGMTRMRVRINYSAVPPPCGVTTYGEVEDYSVNVGGEQSVLTIDPTSIDFGTVPVNSAGNTALTLGADGSANIMFSFDYSYTEKKASVGGGQCSENLKANPFQASGHAPAGDKDANSIFFEGFEGGVIPPTGWTTVVNNPFTWEVDTYAPYEGTYNATCLYDETYVGTQDEWLISPVIDLSGGTYALDFWWNGSFYWSVDPYDNCNLEVWLSTDGGATWLVQLWGEDDFGTFVNWEWNNTVLDLSPFAGESNVKLGFRYYGYDGAQMSLDAVDVYEFTPPLNWLSATPETGTIPGGGTLPITVSYNMNGLEEGTYTADLVITHTGAAKTTDIVPVTITVGEIAMADMNPDPIYALYAFAITPMVGTAFVEDVDLPTGYTTADINTGTVTINGLTPLTTVLNGSVLEVGFSVADFIATYPLMWDITINPYTVDGSFSDATAFSLGYEVECHGHASGDANTDGNVNIGDAVFILSYAFRNGDAPRVMQTADSNCDGLVNIGDAVKIINYVFRNGVSPCHVGQ